jgi:predicted nucleotidyltransferase
MLDVMVTSRTRRKLLGFFVLNAGRRFYLRQIAQEINEAVHSTRLELALLKKAGFLSETGLERQKFYILNESYPYLEEIKSIVAKLKAEDFREFDFTNYSRKALLEENLLRVKEALISKYHPEKIILFGSLAKGKVSEATDIDLLIVKDTQKPYNDRLRDVVSICDYDVGIDFLIYNPDELRELSKNNSFVRNEIIRKGEVLYDKTA